LYPSVNASAVYAIALGIAPSNIATTGMIRIDLFMSDYPAFATALKSVCTSFES
jgi:hypothetical protein